MKLLKVTLTMEMELVQLLPTDQEVQLVKDFSEADKLELMKQSNRDLQAQLGTAGTITCKTIEVAVIDA